MGVRWGSVAPKIAFGEEVIVAVDKLIMDLGARDPEKVAMKGWSRVRFRVVPFTKNRSSQSWTWRFGAGVTW